MMTTTAIERNPMGFYCPPNGAAADVISETDFERFIAYGMCVCWLHDERYLPNDWQTFTPEVIQEIRDNFLNIVEGTLQFLWLGEFEVGQENFDSDMFGDGCETIVSDHEDEEQSTREFLIRWMPFRIDDDCIIFDMDGAILKGEGMWGDPNTLFLDMEAVQDKQLVRDTLRKAHEINAYPYRTEYQNEENDRLWQRILDGKTGYKDTQ